jgi:hypothetical protein
MRLYMVELPSPVFSLTSRSRNRRSLWFNISVTFSGKHSLGKCCGLYQASRFRHTRATASIAVAAGLSPGRELKRQALKVLRVGES